MLFIYIFVFRKKKLNHGFSSRSTSGAHMTNESFHFGFLEIHFSFFLYVLFDVTVFVVCVCVLCKFDKLRQQLSSGDKFTYLCTYITNVFFIFFFGLFLLKLVNNERLFLCGEDSHVNNLINDRLLNIVLTGCESYLKEMCESTLKPWILPFVVIRPLGNEIPYSIFNKF